MTSRTTPSGRPTAASATRNRMPALPRTSRASSTSSSTTRRSALTVMRCVTWISSSTRPSTTSPSRGTHQKASSGRRMRSGCRRSSQALSIAARRRKRLIWSGCRPRSRSGGKAKGAQQLQLGDLGQQALQPDPARDRRPAARTAVPSPSSASSASSRPRVPASRRSATRRKAASSCAARAERRMRSSRYAPGRVTRSRANQASISSSSTAAAGSRGSSSSTSQRRSAASAASSKAATARWSRISAAMPPPGAARPVVAVERVGADADLGGEAPDHRRARSASSSGNGRTDASRRVARPSRACRRRAGRPAAPSRWAQASSARRARPPTTAAASPPPPPRLQTGAYGPDADLVTSDGQNAQLRGHWASSSTSVPTNSPCASGSTRKKALRSAISRRASRRWPSPSP